MSQFFIRSIVSLLVSVGLIACGGGSSTTTNTTVSDTTTNVNTDGGKLNATSFTTQTVDATAGGLGASADNPANKYSYLNLATGQVVSLSDEEAKTSSDWDIAFKRSTFKLNGGLSGTKGVSGYFVGNNSEAYDAEANPDVNWFTAATESTELKDFEDVVVANIPEDSSFKEDSLVKAIVGDGTSAGWWLYDFQTHAVSANTANHWVLKSAEGSSYAKLNITSLTKTAESRDVAITLAIQNTGSTSFSVNANHTFAIPLNGGYLYYDFDSQAEVDASNAAWDFKIGYDATSRTYDIFINGGASGTGSAAAFGPITNPDDYTTGSEIPHFVQDVSGGVFVDSSWYSYNLSGAHKLWPNYRVYLIKSDTKVFKVQFLSYYDSVSGESGHITLRHEEVK